MEGTLLLIALLVIVLAVNIDWHRRRNARDAEQRRREDERDRRNFGPPKDV